MIIGIDPGLDGAVAVLHDDGEVEFHDTPTMLVQGSTRKSRKYDVDEMVSIILGASGPLDSNTYRHGFLVVIEYQQAMPDSLRGKGDACQVCGRSRKTQSSNASFGTGFGYGLWIGIVKAQQLPLEIVHPSSWKRRMMADFGGGKDASILRAKNLSPTAADRLKRKKDHGRAEALLLCHYAQRYLLNQG